MVFIDILNFFLWVSGCSYVGILFFDIGDGFDNGLGGGLGGSNSNGIVNGIY